MGGDPHRQLRMDKVSTLLLLLLIAMSSPWQSAAAGLGLGLLRSGTAATDELIQLHQDGQFLRFQRQHSPETTTILQTSQPLLNPRHAHKDPGLKRLPKFHQETRNCVVEIFQIACASSQSEWEFALTRLLAQVHGLSWM